MAKLSLTEVVIVGVFLLALLMIASIAIRRSKMVSGELHGIGGWLVLPIIGFIATFILTGFNVIVALAFFGDIQLLMEEIGGGLTTAKISFFLSMVFTVAVLLSAAVAIYRIFVSKRNVVSIAIVHYAVLVVGSFVDIWSDRSLATALKEPYDPSTVQASLYSVVAAALWVPYFLKSQRVANTFAAV